MKYAIIALLAVGIMVAAVLLLRVREQNSLNHFIKQSGVSYQPLLPGYSPAGTRFKNEAGSSSYYAKSGLLVLRWVFSAQTLPGQVTLILYQIPTVQNNPNVLPETNNEKTIDLVVNQEKVQGSLGLLKRTDEGLPAPGQRALAFLAAGKDIVLVSYAISDDELIKIAQSLH